MNEIYEKLDDFIIAYKKTTDEKRRRTLHINIVEEAIPLVKKIANVIAMQSGIHSEDLVQVGSIGLIKAIDAFKPEFNTKFKTYATYFIKGEIKHYLRDKAGIIKAPRELQELVFKISAVQKRLADEGIKDPTSDDIARELDIPIEKVEEVINLDRYKSALSLDQYLKGEDEDFSLMDKIPAGDYQELMNSYEDKIMISEAIKKLPPDLREIIELSYYHDMNQREISEHVKISQMQVSRRIKKALHKLYEIIKSSEK